MVQTQEEQEKINNTRSEISHIKRDLDELKGQTNEIFTALIGSKLSRDGGIVRSIEQTKVDVEKLNVRISELEDKESKLNLYLTIIWTLGGALVGFAILASLTHFINKF